MRGVGNLIGQHGAADAGMLGPARYARLKKGAVDDQLPTALKQVEQAGSAARSVEGIILIHGQPWHPPTLGGQRVTGTRQGLFLDKQVLARRLPLLPCHRFRYFHRLASFLLCIRLQARDGLTLARSYRDGRASDGAFANADPLFAGVVTHIRSPRRCLSEFAWLWRERRGVGLVQARTGD